MIEEIKAIANTPISIPTLTESDDILSGAGTHETSKLHLIDENDNYDDRK